MHSTVSQYFSAMSLPAGVEDWVDCADEAVDSVTCCCVVFSAAAKGVLVSGFCVVGSTSFAGDVISCVGVVCSLNTTPIYSYNTIFL